MATSTAVSAADLLSRLSTIATASEGTSLAVRDDTLSGDLTAIKAKWLLGGRKVTSHFRVRLDPDAHEAHFRESAVESSWGVPPPTLTVETSSQFGSRVTTTRKDTGVGGGGVLEFGKVRESFERAVQDAGWKFVYDVF